MIPFEADKENGGRRAKNCMWEERDRNSELQQRRGMGCAVGPQRESDTEC